jgi:beta-lactamase superfamily II metal-dependent hydrolase
LVSEHGRKRVDLGKMDRDAFRADALRVATYYVGPGEAILISRGRNAILVDGGAGTAREKNDDLGRKFARRIRKGSLRAVVASHPHRDHRNFHHVLVTEYGNRFAPGAAYFDNGTPAADGQWSRLEGWQPDLPFERHVVADDPTRDGEDRIPAFAPDTDAHLLRGSTGATSVTSRKYWSLFLFLRFRKAWMLFTGDAYKGYEKLLLERLKALAPRTHVLKVTHHGSSDGTSGRLVSVLRPAIAVASTDVGGGHRLEDDVRDRLSMSAVYATYEGAGPGRDVFLRTDGRIWEKKGFKGVLFEVRTRRARLL